MKKRTALVIASLLLACSAAIYLVQLSLFGDARDTGFYLLQDLAFLPVQIAIVTIAVGMIVAEMQRRERIDKTHMLASSFFAEGGTAIMRTLRSCAGCSGELCSILDVRASWTPADFSRASEGVRAMTIGVSCSRDDLEAVREVLAQHRLSMLVISSNPVLLEHEDFTDMLWAMFHLTDEFTYRGDPSGYTEADVDHLNEDCARALRSLLVNWLAHMGHLRQEYPHLFTIAALEAKEGEPAA
ncbi:MAG: hypothetical protein WAY93_09140 [Atopobiaceae bacterium]|jgi:hypothetical protein|nr:hypothetical protein [Atopobiaceae bacterium]